MVAALVDKPLIVLAGPTGSGKSHLAVCLAQAFGGEIISCDSVAVYREMEIGTAKPRAAGRALVRHHMLDVVAPTEAFTAGEYSRLAREVIAGIAACGRVPIVAGGTGLYLRALLDGLFAAPPSQPALRQRLRSRTADRLHRILLRLDPAAGQRIHPNDAPKLIRAIEVSLAARQPMTDQWQAGRDPLTGYRILRLLLDPPRAELYSRIDRRAAAMFGPGEQDGLVAEAAALYARYGDQRALMSLGYAQATAFLRHGLPFAEAIRQTQQGHRNYAKRQITWFRKEVGYHRLNGFGDEPAVLSEATKQVAAFLHKLDPSVPGIQSTAKDADHQRPADHEIEPPPAPRERTWSQS